ncbi:hypothetical protein A147_09995 [Vibrio splendidus FF-6]|nr:hypothetical protein A147_09995 [Vibrio splendidus FF-6]
MTGGLDSWLIYQVIKKPSYEVRLFSDALRLSAHLISTSKLIAAKMSYKKPDKIAGCKYYQAWF